MRAKNIEATGEGSAGDAAGRQLDVSLVVPVRNEEKSLPALLDSIRRQTHRPAEVIIVDGGSTDETVKTAREIAADSGHNFPELRVIEATEATPGRGRNIGIAAARSEWVALTDAGIRLEPEWLERLVEVVQSDDGMQVVYGNYEASVGSFFERCAALVYLPPKVERAGGRARGPSIASTLLRREVWEAAGGFPDLRAAEDLFFMEQIKRLNFKTGYAPRATVWWQLQPTLGKTFRKFVLYSRHNVWAGRQWDWHYGLARQYALNLIFFALALAHSLWWLALPVAWTLARAAKLIYVRREGRGLLWLSNPVQFAGVVFVMLAIDLATFVGWAQAAWRRGGAASSGSSGATAAQLNVPESSSEHKAR
ncbi:MAG TPA: glycosyltransferase [Pyrinomonadaceae bacterium]|jgi:glycosyltransferase involved in cell wall biosynthesis